VHVATNSFSRTVSSITDYFSGLDTAIGRVYSMFVCLRVQTVTFEMKTRPLTYQIFGMVVDADPVKVKFKGQGHRP